MFRRKTIRYMAESMVAAAQFSATFGQWFEDGVGKRLGFSNYGGKFSFDIGHLMATGVLSSPNVLIFGSLGQGKSSLLSSLTLGDDNKRAIYFDPKGDVNTSLAKRGYKFLDQAVNPFFPHRGRLAIMESNLEIAILACGYVLGRKLEEVESAALSECVQRMIFEANIEILIGFLEQLDDSRGPINWRGRYRVGDLDPLISACNQLKNKKLMSISSPEKIEVLEVILEGGVVDLSDHLASEHLPLRVALILASLRSAKMSGISKVSAVGIDELWALLQDREIAIWIERYFKLSRGIGISNVAVTHSIADLQRDLVGGGLLGAAEVFVSFRQSIDDALSFVKMLGLSPSIAGVISELSVGSTIWLVKENVAVVNLDYEVFE
ncbi:MAG: hypothetical protein M0019_04070 [Actinomycetota bacterium]|nr:hypothetical protein [Actinomycetota bacterium]